MCHCASEFAYAKTHATNAAYSTYETFVLYMSAPPFTYVPRSLHGARLFLVSENLAPGQRTAASGRGWCRLEEDWWVLRGSNPDIRLVRATLYQLS